MLGESYIYFHCYTSRSCSHLKWNSSLYKGAKRGSIHHLYPYFEAFSRTLSNTYFALTPQHRDDFHNGWVKYPLQFSRSGMKVGFEMNFRPLYQNIRRNDPGHRLKFIPVQRDPTKSHAKSLIDGPSVRGIWVLETNILHAFAYDFGDAFVLHNQEQTLKLA